MHVTYLGCYGNVYLRQHILNSGESVQGHKHYYDHVTLITQGKIVVEIEGHNPKEFCAPNFVVINKDIKHTITALEDNTMYFCIFALRDKDGVVIEDMYEAMHDPRSYGADHGNLIDPDTI
jgi:quercetin dioxygenase-like cupin family protein